MRDKLITYIHYIKFKLSILLCFLPLRESWLLGFHSLSGVIPDERHLLCYHLVAFAFAFAFAFDSPPPSSSSSYPASYSRSSLLLGSSRNCLLCLAGSCIWCFFPIYKLTIYLIQHKINVDDICLAEKIRLFLSSHIFHIRALSIIPLFILIH